MAAGPFTQYDNFLLDLGEAKIDLATDTFEVVLLTANYTPAVATDATWGNISANEVATGGGYTQGGVTLPSETLTLSGGKVTWTAGAISWSAFSASARYAVVVHRAGASLASTDLLVAYVDLDTSLAAGTNLVGQGGPLTLTPSASGIIDFTHTP